MPVRLTRLLQRANCRVGSSMPRCCWRRMNSRSSIRVQSRIAGSVACEYNNEQVKGETLMTRITLDRATLEKLTAIRERVELVDDHGQRVGFFDPDPEPIVYESDEMPFSEEELKRADQEPAGRPLEEILRDLEGRA